MTTPNAIYTSVALQQASDTNYSTLTDPYDGQPLKRVPLLALVKQGVRPAKQGPAQYRNWLDNQFAQIQAALIVDAIDVNRKTEALPALNFSAPVSTTDNLTSLCWNDIEQAWYGTQDTSTTAYRTYDNGVTWASTTISNAAQAWDIAADPAGNMVVACNGLFQSGTYGSWQSISWADHVVANIFSVNANIVFEPISGLWCAIGNFNSFTNAVWTSPDRATWTNRTVPTAWHNPLNLTGATIGCVYMGVGNGVIVACFIQTASKFRTMRSLDGGLTWVNDQQVTVNAGITLDGSTVNASITRPVWSSADSLFYIAVSQSGTLRSQVFSSPDGVTWTIAATLLANDCAITSIACLGSMLIGLNGGERNVVSWNRGVTWYRAGSVFVGALARIKSGGNGLMIYGGSQASASARFGLPITPV